MRKRDTQERALQGWRIQLPARLRLQAVAFAPCRMRVSPIKTHRTVARKLYGDFCYFRFAAAARTFYSSQSASHCNSATMPATFLASAGTPLLRASPRQQCLHDAVFRAAPRPVLSRIPIAAFSSTPAPQARKKGGEKKDTRISKLLPISTWRSPIPQQRGVWSLILYFVRKHPLLPPPPVNTTTSPLLT